MDKTSNTNGQVSRSFVDIAAMFPHNPRDVRGEICIQVEHGRAHFGEFMIRWHDLGSHAAPRLEAFCDSWRALAACRDLIEELAKLDTDSKPDRAESLTVLRIRKLLTDLGFEDKTKLPERSPRAVCPTCKRGG